MRLARRALTALLLLSCLAVIVRVSPLWPMMHGLAVGTADAGKPVSLPDMVLGAADAPVTIVEYAAPTCPHCAAFDADRQFATDSLKVQGTPTFFINSEAIVGEVPFEEFASKIKPLLKT
jgi:protein-disulfide isomerase